MKMYPGILIGNLLNRSRLRVEVRELEHLMGPEDSEVNLMYILTQASRRCSSIFELFSTIERSDTQWQAEAVA